MLPATNAGLHGSPSVGTFGPVQGRGLTKGSSYLLSVEIRNLGPVTMEAYKLKPSDFRKSTTQKVRQVYLIVKRIFTSRAW